MEKEKLSQAFIQKYDTLSDTFVIVKRTNEPQQETRRKFEPFSFFKFKSRQNQVLQSDENQNVQEPVVPQPVQNQPVQPQPNDQYERPHQNYPPQQPMPPRPQPVPPANTPVKLSRDAYNKLRILNSLYQNLANSDPTNSEIYNSLAGETLVLQTTMLSIYQLLSGNNSVPMQNQIMPPLTGNICTDLVTTNNYVQDIIDIVLSLQRSVNIQNVDRQLSIITATLLSQKSKLSTLQSTCGENRNGQ